MNIRAGRGVLALCIATAAWVALATPTRAQSPDEMVNRGTAAGADAALLQELRVRAERAGVGQEATTSFLAEAVAAAEAGLPSRMLVQKGLEGLAKQVPPERILSVLAGLHGSLELAAGIVDPWLADPGAREALEPAPEPGDGGTARGTLVESSGLALHGGASEEAIGALLDRIPSTFRGRQLTALRLGVGVEVLADLPVGARNPRIAAELVLEALASGFAAAELRELPAALAAAERRGQLPAEAVARGALAQMQGEIPAAVVLRNLFQGDFPGNVPFELPPGLEKAREGGKGKGPPPS